MQTLQLINLNPESLVEMLAQTVTAKRLNSEETGQLLSTLVPWVTRKQAAYILNASTKFVVSLIDQGELQEHQRPDSAKIKTIQVWQCRLKGLTGTTQNIDLEKIL